jgi:hypothetical protein
MQLVILVYQMSGASQMYHLIVVLSRSYIFLNGFAHFSHYWKLSHPEEKEENPLNNDMASASKTLRFMTVSDNLTYVFYKSYMSHMSYMARMSYLSHMSYMSHTSFFFSHVLYVQMSYILHIYR